MGPEKARRADEQDSGRSGGGLVLILGWIMLALFTPTDVRGGDCFEYGEYLHYVGSLYNIGEAIGVTVDGTHAYIATGHYGFAVVDVSDPATPALLDSIDTPGHAEDVAAEGMYAYVADGTSGLQVIDISDASSLTIIGSVDTPGNATDVVVTGSYAYVADSDHGLQVIDISNPAAPVIVAGANEPGQVASGVAVAGSYAYVTMGIDGFLVVDISNVNSLVIVGSTDMPGHAGKVVVTGGFAYVAAFDYGLHVIDVSNPTSPVIVGSLQLHPPGAVSDLAVVGNYAYLAEPGCDTKNCRSSLVIVDVSTPALPIVAGAIGARARGVAIAGNYAYIVHEYGAFNVIDVTNPTHPRLGSVQGGAPDGDLAVEGHYAYTVRNNGGPLGGLEVIDVSDSRSPQVVGGMPIPAPATQVAVSGIFAYVACHVDGSVVVDVSDPTSPTIVGNIGTAGLALGIAVAGTHAYIASGGSPGLEVADVSDPAAPIYLGAVDTPGTAVDVSVAGNYAYVADGWPANGLRVIDISNPASPTIVGGVDMPFDALKVTVAGNHAYVTGDYETRIVDISDPTLPEIVGGWQGGGGVGVQGDYAYSTNGAGLMVLNVSNPAMPDIVNVIDLGGHVGASLAVTESHVYVSLLVGEPPIGIPLFLILPVQCPTPVAVEVSAFEAMSLAGSVLVTWSTSYESDHLGFHLHGSTDPEGPFRRVNAELIEPPGPYRFLDHSLNPGTTYYYRLEALDRAGGSQFFGPIAVQIESSEAASLRDRLLPSSPNPFRAGGEAAAIRFELARPTGARLRVFDATGRQVRRLADGVMEAGEHTARWDGRNDHGEVVGSGIYFYRLDAGDFSETRTLVWLK